MIREKKIYDKQDREMKNMKRLYKELGDISDGSYITCDQYPKLRGYGELYDDDNYTVKMKLI